MKDYANKAEKVEAFRLNPELVSNRMVTPKMATAITDDLEAMFHCEHELPRMVVKQHD